MDYLDTPEAFVFTKKEFKVDASQLALMQSARMHPLKVAGEM